jgi:hypothetical protein
MISHPGDQKNNLIHIQAHPDKQGLQVIWKPPMHVLTHDILGFRVQISPLRKQTKFKQFKSIITKEADSNFSKKVVYEANVTETLKYEYLVPWDKLLREEVYGVRILLLFKPKGERRFEYHPSLDRKGGELLPLKSQYVEFQALPTQLSDRLAEETKKPKGMFLQPES